MLDRALGGRRTGVEAAAVVLDPADGVPERGEPRVVAGLLEERPSLLDEGFELLDPTLGVGVREEPHVSEARVQLAEPIARGRGALSARPRPIVSNAHLSLPVQLHPHSSDADLPTPQVFLGKGRAPCAGHEVAFQMSIEGQPARIHN